MRWTWMKKAICTFTSLHYSVRTRLSSDVLINGSYHLAETSNGPSTIGNSSVKLFSWHECDLKYQLLRAFDHICMEKVRYKCLIIIIIVIIITRALVN